MSLKLTILLCFVMWMIKAQDKSDRTITINSVGAITKNTTQKDLIKKYGAKNVTKDTIYLGEGVFKIGTRLFADTDDELLIHWKNKTPKFIIIKGKNWKTKEGITIGTTLKTLESLNVEPFILLGLGWDYGGTITNWNNGKLQKNILLQHFYIQLSNTELNSSIKKVLGDIEFKSSNANFKTLNLIVSQLKLKFH